MARNSLLCADVPLRNYSPTHSKKNLGNIIIHMSNIICCHNFYFQSSLVSRDCDWAVG